MTDITFREFTLKNVERSHRVWPQCDDWSRGDWLIATLGELGEAANISKKIERDGITPELLHEFHREVFDIIAYGFLMIAMTGGDPEAVAKEKWDEVSERNNFSVRL